MKDEIEKIIRDNKNGTSFMELSRIEGFKGDLSMGLSETVIIWGQISRAAMDAIAQLRAEGKIGMRTTAPLTYIIDGYMPSLPVARNPDKRDYVKPHWLPVCFDPIEAS